VSGSIWEVLAIPPTDDAASIRRAYAMRLKQCRPEEDAAAFVRLRAAYEVALRGAATPPPPRSAPPPSEAAPADSAAPPAVTQPVAEQAAALPPAPALRVAAAISQGDVQAAADLLLAARGDATMPIGPWMHLTDLLARRLAYDPRIADDVVETLARRFGWFGTPDPSGAGAANALRARIEAAHWLDIIRAEGKKLTRFVGNERAAAAALLTGRGRLTISFLLPPYAQLREMLSFVTGHGGWAERGLDADRLARLRALSADRRGERIRRYAARAFVAVLFAVSGRVSAAVMVGLLVGRVPHTWLRPFCGAAIVLAALTLLIGVSDGEELKYGLTALMIGVLAATIAGVTMYLRDLMRGGLWAGFARAAWLLLRAAIAFYVGSAVAANFDSPNAGEIGNAAGVGCFILLSIITKYVRIRPPSRWRPRRLVKQRPSI
jgi:hypothetical protein